MLNVHVFVQPFPNKQTSPNAKAYQEIIIVVLISVFENCKRSFQNFLTDYMVQHSLCVYNLQLPSKELQLLKPITCSNLTLQFSEYGVATIGKEKITFWHSVIFSFLNQGSPSKPIHGFLFSALEIIR